MLYGLGAFLVPGLALLLAFLIFVSFLAVSVLVVAPAFLDVVFEEACLVAATHALS